MGIKSFIKSIGENLSKKSYTGLLQSVSLREGISNWGKEDFLKANEISLYVNKCIAKRAEKVGEIDFVLKKGDKVIERHELLNLLYKPNKIYTKEMFWSLYQKYLDLTGDVYIWMESSREIFDKKKISALHLLRPDLVTMVVDNDTGELQKYVLRKPGGTEIPYKPEEIIHIFEPNPISPFSGMSLLAAGTKAIDTENQISEYHSKILRNGGKVEGVFKFKTDKLSPTQLKELKDDYKRKYSEAKRSGQPLFLGGDWDYVNIGLNPQELSFLEAKNITLNDILIMCGTPKSVLGSFDDIKFDNADASIKIFLRETIKPLLKKLTTNLDEVLFPDDLTLEFVDPTPEDVDRQLKVIDSGIKNYYMTPNEVRKMQGMDPIDGGDDLLVPFSVTPLGQEKQAPIAPQDQNNQDPNKDNTQKQKGFNHPLKDDFFRKRYGQLMIKRMDKNEKKLVGVIDDYFSEQEARLTARLDAGITRTFRRKGLLDEIWDSALELSIAKEKFLPVLQEMLKRAGVDAMELAGSTFTFSLSGEIASWLDKKVNVFSDINETTFKKLTKQFEESLAANESRQDLIKRIQGAYGDISKGRAATIARTEVLGVTQKGTFEGYKQANMPIKIWVAVMDSHTRDSHAMMDGEEVPIDMPFSNGLHFPGEYGGPAEEVINCRCTI